jgi:beta-glucosidase/6-phospho-beta-glucosidase/beta-galactosidase
MYPKGFRDVLGEPHARYHKPIWVLENGVADRATDDRQRAALLVTHAREMWLAMRDGADVRGYFHWSLEDNFEWAQGYGPRFGILEVDYSDFHRTPRQSARIFRQIAASNAVDAELWAPYATARRPPIPSP